MAHIYVFVYENNIYEYIYINIISICIVYIVILNV